MDSLLQRQLRKHLPNIDRDDPRWRPFLSAVDAAYAEHQEDRRFLEHTLEVTSEELSAQAEQLKESISFFRIDDNPIMSSICADRSSRKRMQIAFRCVCFGLL